MPQPEGIVMTYRRKLPYDAHPLYHQRKLLIITALIGAALCLLTINTTGRLVFTTSLLFLALSTFLAACDLNCCAMKKAQNPDEDLDWPRVVTMVADLLLAILLQLAFWASAATAENMYRGSSVCAAYAALADLLCSLLHAYCLWEQIEARCKKKWLAGLDQMPCKQCGHRPSEDLPARPQHLARASRCPSADANHHMGGEPRANATPSCQDSRLEEGLLIDSDLGSAYGAIDHQEQYLEQPKVVTAGNSKKPRQEG